MSAAETLRAMLGIALPELHLYPKQAEALIALCDALENDGTTRRETHAAFVAFEASLKEPQ